LKTICGIILLLTIVDGHFDVRTKRKNALKINKKCKTLPICITINAFMSIKKNVWLRKKKTLNPHFVKSPSSLKDTYIFYNKPCKKKMNVLKILEANENEITPYLSLKDRTNKIVFNMYKVTIY